MPLIDDRSRGTEQRSRPRWPWVLVVLGFAVLWMAVAVLVSLLPRTLAPSSPVKASVAQQQQYHRTLVSQAQSYLALGDAATASGLIDSIPADAPLEISDKHTYFRTAAQVKRKNGDPAAAAAYYERFLAMGAGVLRPECQSCHGGASAVAPHTVVDLETSSLGTEYVSALRAAGKLPATRKRLLLDLQKRPHDPRAHLLLYHVEKGLGNRRAAAEHGDALKDATPVR